MPQTLLTLLQRPEIWGGALALAGFLMIFWILRGSAPGQAAAAGESDAAPSPWRRDRSIALVSCGLVLILVAAGVSIARGILWSLPIFAAGTGLVLFQNIANQAHRHPSPSLRRTAELSNLFLNSALLAGILVVANVAAFRYGGRTLDFTREQTYSLSSLSMRQLESLKRPVAFHLVYGSGPRAARQLDRAAQLLELYRSINPSLIKVDSLNPYTELARAEDLAKKAPDLAVMRGGGVLIEYGEGKDAEFVVVTGQEMFEPVTADPARQGPDRFETRFKGEDAITSALIRLREGRKAKVAFTTGHGEAATSDLNPSGPGIGVWRARLASVGCEAVELNLVSDPIPDDVSLVIIAGPKAPFKAEELARLKAYAEGKGPVLALVGNTEPSGLDEFLRSFNLEIGRGLVIDPALNFNRNVQLVFAPLKGGNRHPITDGLASDRAVLVPNAGPIVIRAEGSASPGQAAAPVNRNLVPIAILRTGPQSWAETDLTNPRPRLDRGADTPGPVTVGVAVQERPAPGGDDAAGGPSARPRLVLFSSRSLADNIVQGIEPANLDLVMNAVSWLRGRPDAVGIAPNTHVALTLIADPVLRGRLVLVPTILALMAIIGAGVLVYVARRG